MRTLTVVPPTGDAPARDDAAERARHLERVCASFPTKISRAGAERLARLLTPAAELTRNVA